MQSQTRTEVDQEAAVQAEKTGKKNLLGQNRTTNRRKGMEGKNSSASIAQRYNITVNGSLIINNGEWSG